MWITRERDSTNDFSQILHWWGFSPVCVLVCCFCLLESENDFSQKLHWYGFSPVWDLWCLIKLVNWMNDFLHISHRWGLSPVWALMCLSRCPERLNTFSQIMHWWSFLPVWVIMCVVKFGDELNGWSQTLMIFIYDGCNLTPFLMTHSVWSWNENNRIQWMLGFWKLALELQGHHLGVNALQARCTPLGMH